MLKIKDNVDVLGLSGLVGAGVCPGNRGISRRALCVRIHSRDNRSGIFWRIPVNDYMASAANVHVSVAECDGVAAAIHLRGQQ